MSLLGRLQRLIGGLRTNKLFKPMIYMYFNLAVFGIKNMFFILILAYYMLFLEVELYVQYK